MFIGCIFAELLIHDAFFRGDNPQHQLEVIVSKLGYVYVYMSVYTYMSICIFMRVSVCVCFCICMYICMLIREAFFRGDNPQRQLEVIESILGYVYICLYEYIYFSI
jgi:hypothetical protein